MVKWASFKFDHIGNACWFLQYLKKTNTIINEIKQRSKLFVKAKTDLAHAQRWGFHETSTWDLFLDLGSHFAIRACPVSGTVDINSQSNKGIQTVLSISFCFALEIMSHNSMYYLKKLSKKTPSGCSKLENFGFGKQVIQGEHSAKINRPLTSDNHSEPSNVRLDYQCSSNTPHPSSDKPPTHPLHRQGRMTLWVLVPKKVRVQTQFFRKKQNPQPSPSRNVPLLNLMGENLLAWNGSRCLTGFIIVMPKVVILEWYTDCCSAIVLVLQFKLIDELFSRSSCFLFIRPRDKGD